MSAADIQKLTRAIPFAPFRVEISAGRTYDITHPDMIVAGLTSAYIMDATGDVDLVSLRHVVRLLPLSGAKKE